MVPTAQEMTFWAVHVPWVLVAVPVTPGGSVSVTTTPVAGLGPSLTTVSV